MNEEARQVSWQFQGRLRNDIISEFHLCGRKEEDRIITLKSLHKPAMFFSL